MDCGPATLKCLLGGHGIEASYGRLREACQTDVDGTSVDAIEDTACRLGLAAEQLMLPVDHLWTAAADALPALLVIERSDGFAHFVVAWRRLGDRVLVMDPAQGRRWMERAELERGLLRHRQPVAVDDWLAWARGAEFGAILGERLCRLGFSASRAGRLLDAARAAIGWQALATLDAVQRMVGQLVAAGAIARGRAAVHLVETLVVRVGAQRGAAHTLVPARYWAVAQPAETPPGMLVLQGVVLVRVRGRTAATLTLSPELAAALAEPPPRPLRDLFTLLREEGWLTPAALVLAVTVAAATALLEALLLRGLFDLSDVLVRFDQRAAALAALLVFMAALALLEWPIARESQRIGRQWELRLRRALLTKLPRLPDRYLASRPISDIVDRAHAVTALRQAPAVLCAGLTAAAHLACTWLGIALVAPASAAPAALLALLAIALPLAAQRALAEREMRLRNQSATLQGFYLDALQGCVPIRAHAGERAVSREHEAHLAAWMRAFVHRTRLALAVQAVQHATVMLLAALILVRHLGRAGVGGELLLLAYWLLRLPSFAQALGGALLALPGLRTVATRLHEPLAAPDSDTAGSETSPATAPTAHGLGLVAARAPQGVAVRCRGLGVVAGGHTLLDDIDLALAPGEQVAVVGSSGAGKSTLVAALLGWHRPAHGTIEVDGEILDGPRIASLRAQTAWIDPAVQLWNQGLAANLTYASSERVPRDFDAVLTAADLKDVLARLPAGLQTPLGEGGGLLSGGEGQRVRLGRALAQGDVRLVLLDEPFRGLDHTQRRLQLARVRQWWPQATLLCVTHDIATTRGFARVLVVDGGRLVEDGSPQALLARRDSHYRALLAAELRLERELWSDPAWRRLRVAGGCVEELPSAAHERRA